MHHCIIIFTEELEYYRDLNFLMDNLLEKLQAIKIIKRLIFPKD